MSLEHTTSDPADLLTPEQREWLAGTMAKNTARFGGWSMDASDSGDTGGDSGDDSSDDSGNDDGTDSQGSGDDDKADKNGADDDSEDGDDKRVSKANKEAQRYREQLRTLEKKAAEDSKVLDALKKALNGDTDAPADPKALAAEVEKQKSDMADLRVALAVHNLAGSANANASALLDSKSFTSSLAGLDPETDAKKITAAIKEAVQKNPAYRLTQGSGSGGGDIDPGKREDKGGKPKSLEQAIAARLGK